MCKLFQKLIIGGVAIKLGVGGEGCGWKIFQKLIIRGGGGEGGDYSILYSDYMLAQGFSSFFTLFI